MKLSLFNATLPLFLLILSAATAGENNGTSGLLRGSVREAETLAPVAGARVYLLDMKVCKIGGARLSVRTARDDFLIPHYQRAAYEAATDAQGSFSLDSVAAGEPFTSYTVLIRAPGLALFVVHNARVYPGNPLIISARLAKAEQPATWFEGTDKDAPVSYGRK